jgi:hypothetical protein
MSHRCFAKSLKEDASWRIHHTEETEIFDSKLTADYQEIFDAHIVSGA